jgi:hypothetical protein
MEESMGRERVSKGVIIPKKDEKVIDVLMGLEPNVSDEDFFKAFSDKYSADLDRVQKRYDEHERLTKPGKSHPMARPYQYMLNAAEKIRDQYRKGKDLRELLEEINTPKPKFMEECPHDIQKMIEKSADLSSYESRVDAVNMLGKWKCDESINALSELMACDPVYDVRDTAYQRLKRFGLEVTRPHKGKAYVDPDIQSKLIAVAAELKPGFSLEKFDKKFKIMRPADYDLLKYHKKNQFKDWLKKIYENLPKHAADA